MQSTGPPQPSQDVTTSRRATAAASIGHVVEYYDFSIYALLAPVLAQIFFPSQDHVASVLAAFGVFGVAYVVRPLGGLVFGHLGDKLGRRTTLSAVILLMSAATAAIGVLPGHAQIGTLAPALLIVCRSLQGLSTGGEYAGSASFVAEHAPAHRRGLFTSWVIGSTGLGLTLGALTGTLLTSTGTSEALRTWGWRLPFLLALPLGLIGLYLRLRLDDAPAFKAARRSAGAPRLPVLEAVRAHHRAILTLAGMVLLLTTAIYVFFTYLTTYLNVFLRVPLDRALPASIIGFVLFFALTPVFGHLSDRVGRKPVLIAGAIGHIALTYPAFVLLQQRSFLCIAVAYVTFALIYATYVGPFTAAVTEQFPAVVRAAGLGIGYNVPVCLFGGLSPLFLTYLISRLHDSMIPAYYVIGGALVTLPVVLRLKTTDRSPAGSRQETSEPVKTLTDG
jgi:MFS transporter, MHS family, proline/betaine transporter